MAVDDTELVALIDKELNEKEKSRQLSRLVEDEGLRKRYEELRDAGVLITASLDALVKNAPLARLRSMLPSVSVTRPGRWPFSVVALRDLAAGFVLGLLSAGAAAWVALSAAPSHGRDDWRSAVAEYIRMRPSRSRTLTGTSKPRS
jgi:anti-sigma factor RsiW